MFSRATDRAITLEPWIVRIESGNDRVPMERNANRSRGVLRSFGEIEPDWERMTPFVEAAMSRARVLPM